MVEMKPTNNKLRQRAELMVAELAGVDIDSARRAFAEGGTIKIATVMLLKGMQRAEAEALLAKSHGNLQMALSP
jgi:N-acetylmuramic acid 6-phosphate etherase